MTVILGPVPCQGCRRPVTWNGWEWHDSRGYLHKCAARALRARAREAWDNTSVGDGDESNNLRADPRSEAITRRAGVAASIEVMAR